MSDIWLISSSALGATNSQDWPLCHWGLHNPLSSCFLFPGSALYLLMCWIVLFLVLILLLHPILYSLVHSICGVSFDYFPVRNFFLTLATFPLSNFLPHYYVCLLWIAGRLLRLARNQLSDSARMENCEGLRKAGQDLGGVRLSGETLQSLQFTLTFCMVGQCIGYSP